MKRVLILFLAIVMVFTFVSCDSSDETPETTTEENLTAQEKLTEQEKRLFDTLIKMTTDHFYEPSAVRVLQIGDYTNDTINGHFDSETNKYIGDSREIIVVKLQGENKVGGTLNHCYKISLTTHEDTSTLGQSAISSYQSFALNQLLSDMLGSGTASSEEINKRRAEVMDYKAETGDYAELSNSYSIEEDASDEFNIGRINRALAEYWEDLGF